MKPALKDSHASLLYAIHFPNVNSSQHESNQRSILLYGVGRERKEYLNLLNNMEQMLMEYFDFNGNSMAPVAFEKRNDMLK